MDDRGKGMGSLKVDLIPGWQSVNGGLCIFLGHTYRSAMTILVKNKGCPPHSELSHELKASAVRLSILNRQVLVLSVMGSNGGVCKEPTASAVDVVIAVDSSTVISGALVVEFHIAVEFSEGFSAGSV